jgi:hypothetical protein
MTNMQNYKVDRSQLKEKIGQIVSWNYEPKLGENKFQVCLDGKQMIWVKSRLTECEFNMLFQ